MKLPWQTPEPQGAELRPMLTTIQGSSLHSSGIDPSSDYSSYNMVPRQIIKSDTNTVVENSIDTEIVLMDTNLTKTAVAYVTKNGDKAVIWELCISHLNAESTTIFNAKTTYGIDISSHICDHVENSTMFLSISPKGRKVAISFLPNETDESTNGKTSNCIILKLSEDLRKIVRTEKIEAQGRAVFTKTGQLAILNKNQLSIHHQLYSRYFQIKHNFDMKDLFELFDSSNCPTTSTFQYQLCPPNTAYSSATNLDIQSTQYLMTMSQFMNHGILLSPLQTKIHVWSVQDKCARLTTIFREETEEIIGISDDKRFLVTYVENKRIVNVYETDYGRKMYVLETQSKMAQETLFEVSSVHFSNGFKYLILIGVEKTYQFTKSTIEVWQLESTLSIYSNTVTIDADSRVSNIQTYVKYVENEYDHLTVYFLTSINNISTLQTYGIDINESKQILPTLTVNAITDIQQIRRIGPNEENEIWRLVSAGVLNTSNFLTKRLNELCGKIPEMLFYGRTYRYVYGGHVHLLFFGLYTIQLWQLGKNKEDTDILLFIHTYMSFDFGKEGESQTIFCYLADYHEEDNVQFLSIGSDESILRAKVVLLGSISEKFTKAKKLFEFEMKEEVHIPLLQTENGLDTTGRQLKCVYLKLRSACQTLFYLSEIRQELQNYKRQQNVNIFGTKQIRYEEYDTQQEAINTMIKATEEIIQNCINDIMQNPLSENHYFKTSLGSDILTILSAFEEGDKFLYQILCAKELPIALFSTERTSEIYNLRIPDNALLRLLKDKRYSMYELLFNRIIFTAKTSGIGYISTLTDAILYLQSYGQVDYIPERRLLEVSMERLRHLHIDLEWLPLSRIEQSRILDNANSKIETLNCGRALEQLEEKKLRILRYLKVIEDKFNYAWVAFVHFSTTDSIMEYFPIYGRGIFQIIDECPATARSKEKNAVLCVVPLVKFLSYEDEDKYAAIKTGNNKRSSRFLKVALNRKAQSLFSLDGIFLEALLWYKWNQLSKIAIFTPFFPKILFYILFAVCIAFGPNVFGYVFMDGEFHVDAGYILLVVCMIFIEAYLIVQEVLFIKSQIELMSFGTMLRRVFNIVSLLLPVAAAFLLITGSHYFESFCSLVALLLWIHGILTMRISLSVDILLATIKEIVVSMTPVFVLMMFIILAFTSIFAILLGRRDDSFFGESSNSFNNGVSAFFNLWFFIFGVWEPINDGDVGEYYLVKYYAFIFTVIIVLILFNYIIAEMNNSIQRIRKIAKKNWFGSFAALLAEAELQSKGTLKYNQNYNPPYLYYRSTLDIVKQHERELEESTAALIRDLGIDFASGMKISFNGFQESFENFETFVSKKLNSNSLDTINNDNIKNRIKVLKDELKNLRDELNISV